MDWKYYLVPTNLEELIAFGKVIGILILAFGFGFFGSLVLKLRRQLKLMNNEVLIYEKFINDLKHTIERKDDLIMDLYAELYDNWEILNGFDPKLMPLMGIDTIHNLMRGSHCNNELDIEKQKAGMKFIDDHNEIFQHCLKHILISKK